MNAINSIFRYISSICIGYACVGMVHAQTSQYKEVLDRYCVYCHNETLLTANLALDKTNLAEIGQDPAVWEKVLLKLKTRSMPPVGMPRPEDGVYVSFATHLQTELDRLAAASPDPGRKVATHRLSRLEYTNAVRDLLGIEIDGTALLPPDNSGDFDNLGELLTITEIQMEKYMSTANLVGRRAVGEFSDEVDSKQYTLSPLILQNDRMSEDMPFGSRGGMSVRHYFPQDGEYTMKIRLQRTDNTGLVIGLSEPRQIDVRVDGKRVKLFTVGGENVALALGAGRADKVPPDFDQAQYERTADDPLEIRFPVQAGMRDVQVTFLKDEFAWANQIPPRTFDNYSASRLKGDYSRAWAEPALSNILITGPYNVKGAGNTVSRERIFICTPNTKADEEPCAKSILSKMVRLAYRRPVNDADINPFINLFRQGASNELGSFDAGIQLALEGLLVSTEFLYRVERGQGKTAGQNMFPVSDLELASRLSFFLWSSIPDEELLSVAEQGKLQEPAILEHQVRRMLKDSRSVVLVDNFATQWLLLRNLSHTNKNQELFPQFDENLRKDLYEETRLFVDSIFRDDRSILDMFRADYKFVNERLARHYGLSGVAGNRFRKVSVSDVNKQGLLAHGSILAITSYPNRTSPVLRGKWVLENILAAPPPPPPVNIPALVEEDDTGKTFTMREAIEKHRANPVCATCHNRMDPIGFGLENFNPIGLWRTEDAGEPIDSSGMLPDGSHFQGPAELQSVLLKQTDVIVSAFTQKLLTYAMGRDLEYFDMPTVRKIVSDTEQSDYRFSDIVIGIINSLPFQMRRAES